MGAFSLRREHTPAPRPQAVVAAAMPLAGKEGRQAWNASSGDTGWQDRAWYFYDAIGELKFAFNWLANALSRAVLYAAETDPETGQITGPTEDARAQAAAQAVLGGPENLPRILTLVAVQWQVGGETYILISPRGAGLKDRWEALSRRSLRERGGSWQYKDPMTGVWTPLRSQDRLIRVWRAHPDEQTHADSAMRAAVPICAEIEMASQSIASRLDSRLAGNGMFFIPQEVDFPVAEGEQADAASLMKLLYDASVASLSDPGTAAAHVPIMVQVPGEYIAALAEGHVDLSTTLDSEVPKLREENFVRLGRSLDMSAEIAMSRMAEANHWSAWQVEETTYKIHLEPFLLRFGMALTTEYFRGALRSMGEENPDRFVLNWDVTEVVSRPDDKEDLKYLYENLLVSDDYMRSEFGVPDDAIPDDQEIFLRRLAAAVSVAPTLAAQEEIALKLFGLVIAPEAAGVAAGAAVDPSNALEPGSSDPEPGGRGLPARPGTAPESDDAGLTAAAELVVFDALSRAGGRLLTPAYRGQFKDTPRHELHTVIPVGDDPGRLLEGSFVFTDRVAGAFNRDPDLFRAQIKGYVTGRLRMRAPHDREVLRGYLEMK